MVGARLVLFPYNICRRLENLSGVNRIQIGRERGAPSLEEEEEQKTK
jgi:hypothetical protein